MSKSVFDDWFAEQHGKRPSKVPTMILLRDVVQAQNALAKARKLLNDCDRYDAMRTSALYAWQAAPERKHGK